jgi:RAD51-like protein 2
VDYIFICAFILFVFLDSSFPSSTPSCSTAYSLFQQDLHTKSIFTCCEAMDKMLGGGIKIGQMTEFYGMPGIGKTQLG